MGENMGKNLLALLGPQGYLFTFKEREEWSIASGNITE